MMDRRLAILPLLALAGTSLSGCVAVAIPALAGSTMFGSRLVDNDDEAAANAADAVASAATATPAPASSPAPAPAAAVRPAPVPTVIVARGTPGAAQPAPASVPAPASAPAPAPAPEAVAPAPVAVRAPTAAPVQGPVAGPVAAPAPVVAQAPAPVRVVTRAPAAAPATVAAAAPAPAAAPAVARAPAVAPPPAPAAPAAPVATAAAAPAAAVVKPATAFPDPARPLAPDQAGFARFVRYGQATARGAEGGADLTSAMLSDPVALDGKRRRCAVGEQLVALIDLDPAGGIFAPPARPAKQPGLVLGLAVLREAGVEIAWISDLPVQQSGLVRTALEQAGLDPRGEDIISLRRDADDHKQQRKENLAGITCIVAIAGDERADFDERFKYLRSPEAGAGLEPVIGDGWFLIPSLVAEAGSGGQ
jgi:hypothetical protein